MEHRKGNTLLPVYCFGVIALFVIVLIVPQSRAVFGTLSAAHPFIMGFIKFALLATAGELIAGRIGKKRWEAPPFLWARLLIWGVIGMWITYMMKVFSAGIAGLLQTGVLPGGSSRFLHALLTSATMNLTFGPTFMAVHKCSDQWLLLRSRKSDSSLGNVIRTVDWPQFVGFTLLKTVPLFWIPAHTVTFLLPVEYQVVTAAALSIALGVILSARK